MKPLVRSFNMFIQQIFRDSMLAVVCLAPILTAVVFRFGVPYLEGILCGYFQKTVILANYYLLFDLFLCLITPYMFCFASAMVMLTEYDENMTGYLAVTPVGKSGYILSRLLFPAVISILASLLLLRWFSLTAWTFGLALVTACLTGILSIVISLLIFSFSHNRVEGMAVAKLSGLMMAGLPIPFLVRSEVQYLFAPLPSFWTAKMCLENNGLLLAPALLSSLLWIGLLYRRFKQKIA